MLLLLCTVHHKSETLHTSTERAIIKNLALLIKWWRLIYNTMELILKRLQATLL